MSDQFIGEIRIFPFTFAPRGWAFCDGQVLPVDQHTGLFSVLGTLYGGDGKETFALPDLRGRAPMQHGHGPGLSDRLIGESGGSATVTLQEAHLPPHSHTLRAAAAPADLEGPSSSVVLTRSSGGSAYTTNTAGLVPMAPAMIYSAGSSIPHNNMMPYLTFNFCIALEGVYPSRP